MAVADAVNPFANDDGFGSDDGTDAVGVADEDVVLLLDGIRGVERLDSY